MSESLRAKCVEAGGPHMIEFFEAFCDDAPLWPKAADTTPWMTNLLDAVLDCLAENTDEWTSVGRLIPRAGGMGIHPPQAHRLIDALRGDFEWA